MGNDSFKVKKALNIEPNSAPNLSTDGDMGFNSSDSNLELYTGGSVKKVVTDSQTQTLTNKTLTAPTFTGTVTTPVTASRALVTGASSELAASATTATELGYVSGVTSAVQTQIDDKMSNPMTTGGDVIYGGASGVPTRLANGSSGQVLTSAGGTAAPTWSTLVPALNQIQLSGGSGHGSTNTKIRRFTTIHENTGSAMTLTQSATDGDSITINTAGVYAITYADFRGAGVTAFGLSLSSANLTTNISSLTIAQGKRLQIGTSAAGTPHSVCTSIFLGVSDVVRAHTNGDVDSTGEETIFRIVKTS